MTAYNIVRFRVKPGSEQAFIDAHKTAAPKWKGFRGGALVKTGERTFCIVAEWASFQKIVDARPQMIGMLDTFRGMLTDGACQFSVTNSACLMCSKTWCSMHAVEALESRSMGISSPPNLNGCPISC